MYTLTVLLNSLIKLRNLSKIFEHERVTIRDVFVAVDELGDNNGTISINEFQSFVRRFGMEFSRERVNEIFAHIKNKKQKPGRIEKTDDMNLNIEEFEKAFEYVKDKKTSMSLEKLGVSPALLFITLATSVLILILLFVFIFFGINAFAMGGTFGSIKNSLIPMIATGGYVGSQENIKDKLKEEEISNAIYETQAIIHSENI
ncbi:phage head-tail adaptor family protein, putative (macronuclear) [Tetrahymena thermophila SB210]|uniref:Phage head-tail adaptor family protein, putative n=1 Tax=Tetrahymena thermophila (strain SB210) TaxID=312017 RepID=Q22M49_TETTS|nr:phage head-tail adaptor family protein, putative [Tetrahymena thermophila SB210]EAR86345.2 phage head-tail adaptor family protein, putative [Tetrahymena thermophila SB210]|eukprot:XP_977171.2 phage head-tail adaptor family protein, putative [Tetrahymena thermophila SB210]